MEMVQLKMEQLGIKNRSAYLRNSELCEQMKQAVGEIAILRGIA